MTGSSLQSAKRRHAGYFFGALFWPAPPHSGLASHLSVSVALVQHDAWGEPGAGALLWRWSLASGGVEQAEADAELPADGVCAAATCGERKGPWNETGSEETARHSKTVPQQPACPRHTRASVGCCDTGERGGGTPESAKKSKRM